MVLKWIVGAGVDHPLADVKQSRALITELPAESARALKQITEWLEALPGTEGLKTDRLLEIIELVDTAARNHQRKLFQDYLSLSRQQKLHEHAIWTCGHGYCEAVAAAYQLCASRCDANAGGAAAARKSVHSIIARALRARTLQMKWTMARYAPLEPGFWSTIGDVYRKAETGAFTDTAASIYAGVNGTTVRREYLKVFMLAASHVDVLPPIKQDLAERLINYYVGYFRLESAPSADALYSFDRAQDHAPVRIAASSEPPRDAHFFGPGAARGKVAELAQFLEQGGAVPDELNLGKTYAPDVLSAVKHLAVYWSEKPPTRNAERRTASARVTVVPGYRALVDEFERQQDDALNFSGGSGESWVVENVSANGYGALVPASAGDWVRTGEIIGVQGQGKTGWTVAIVRRVVRDERRQFHVGMEVVSRNAAVARVAFSTGREPEAALLLADKPNAQGELGVVLRSTRYHPASSLEAEIDGAPHLLMPARLVESGEDYDRAIYKALRKET